MEKCERNDGYHIKGHSPLRRGGYSGFVRDPHAFARERQLPQPHARRIGDAVGDHGRGGPLRGFAGAEEGLAGARDDVDRNAVRNAAKTQDRIGLPVDAGDVDGGAAGCVSTTLKSKSTISFGLHPSSRAIRFISGPQCPGGSSNCCPTACATGRATRAVSRAAQSSPPATRWASTARRFAAGALRRTDSFASVWASFGGKR